VIITTGARCAAARSNAAARCTSVPAKRCERANAVRSKRTPMPASARREAARSMRVRSWTAPEGEIA